MTDLLLRLTLRGKADYHSPHTRAKVGSLSGAVGIGANVLLFAGKLLAGILTGSVSITADAMNNLSDASSSIVTLLGFKLAQQPPDEDHPYGHARFEYLSGLAVAVMIMLIGFELGKSSVEKILNPTAVDFSFVAAGVLLASIAVKLWLFLFNKKLGRLISSTTLEATAQDSRNDCVSTLAVLAAAMAEYFFDIRIDGYVGLGVAAFILWSGWGLARQTISPLLGEAASPELRELIVDYITLQPHVLGYHDLMVHDYGPGQRFASLHVEMDAADDPLYCHEIIDDMERECLRSHNIHLVIHYDPVITNDPEINRLRDRCMEALYQWDPRLTLHDFRMVRGSAHTNLIFDVSLPHDLRGQEKAIQKQLNGKLNEGSAMVYHTVITFDPAEFNVQG
ncbi:MAG: cation transporter [Oscillospiraceae bacterium]|nr:cation transporter [Oscillospiraceae bacterium]